MESGSKESEEKEKSNDKVELSQYFTPFTNAILHNIFHCYANFSKLISEVNRQEINSFSLIVT